MRDDDDHIEAVLRAHADLGLNPDTAPREHAAKNAAVYRWRAEAAPRRFHRRVPVVVALLALSTAGVAVAATGVWTPTLGGEQRGHPTRTTSDVPAAQLKRFGVLRREANSGDRDAVTQDALRYFNGPFRGVRTERIRAAQGLPDAQRQLIVPVENSEAMNAPDALCLFSVEKGEGGGIGCWTTRQIVRGQALMITLPEGPTSPRAGDLRSLQPGTAGATVIGLVPDGVDEVASEGSRARVHDNVFVLSSSRVPQHEITWLNSDGETIRKH